MRIHDTQRPEITPEAFAQLGGPNTVYIRALAREEVSAIPGLPEGFADSPDSPTLYAIHTIDGQRVAVTDNRESAFLTARQNEMEPVSVH